MKLETVRSGGNGGKVGAMGSAMGDDSLELSNGRLVATAPRCVARRSKTSRKKERASSAGMTMP